tara:strand:- start:336 stop:1310 length:975 start_codon:yes stop_codon:yes gene_type:complete
VEHKKLDLLSLLIIILFVSCGGGGSDPVKTYTIPIVAIDGPKAIQAGAFSTSGCNGSSFDECIVLNVVTSEDPDNLLLFLNTSWNNRYRDPQECKDYSISTDGFSLTSPVYCSDTGYDCDYNFNYQRYDPRNNMQIFSDTATHSIRINADPCTSSSGYVIDGYISGALVFNDINENFIHDDNEPFTFSDVTGYYYLEGLESNLIVSIGGYDVSRDIKFPENFILVSEINREDLSILSPLTTLEYFSDSNVDILQKVGLPQKYKIKSTDHVDGYEYDQNKADAYNKSMFLVDYIIKNNRITKENSSEVWIKAAEKVFSENDFFVK